MNQEQNSLMQDVATSAAIGGAGAVARQVFAKEPIFTRAFRAQAVMASFVAIFSNFIIKDIIHSETMRIGCIGVLSFCAPEVLKRLILLVKMQADIFIKKSRD